MKNRAASPLVEVAPSVEAERLGTVDALRGLAALSVCWFHMTNGYAPESAVRQSGSFGWLGVDIFFVISGFILPFSMWQRKYKPVLHWKLFLWKRLIRIEPAYLVAVILTLALWHLSAIFPSFQGKAPPSPFSAGVLSHFGYLNGILGYDWLSPVFWTLALEFQFYLLLAIGFKAITSKSELSQLLVILVMACAFLAVPANSLVFRYLGLFLFGVVVFQYRSGFSKKPLLAIGLGLAFLSVWASQGMAAALVSIVTCAVLIADIPLGRIKGLAALGAVSYSLYLVHVPIGGCVINFGVGLATTEASRFALSCTGVVLSVIAAYTLYRFVERPSRELAASLTYARLPPEQNAMRRESNSLGQRV